MTSAQQANLLALKSLHFVTNWQEETKLAKLKPVFDGRSI